VQAVTLAAGRAALLVSTQAGFEHLHRRHDLLMVRDGRLQLAWSAVDPQGPAWSTVVVRRRGAGAEEILYMSAFYSSEEAQVDRLEIQHVAWDARAGAVAVTPVGCRDGVVLIVSQAFATLEKALAAGEQLRLDAARRRAHQRSSRPIRPPEGLLAHCPGAKSAERGREGAAWNDAPVDRVVSSRPEAEISYQTRKRRTDGEIKGTVGDGGEREARRRARPARGSSPQRASYYNQFHRRRHGRTGRRAGQKDQSITAAPRPRRSGAAVQSTVWRAATRSRHRASPPYASMRII
jgi:hypothetical protein